jgi:hypothetical protein
MARRTRHERRETVPATPYYVIRGKDARTPIKLATWERSAALVVPRSDGKAVEYVLDRHAVSGVITLTRQVPGEFPVVVYREDPA